MDFEQLKQRFDQAGQGHVFRYWDELPEIEKAGLLSQAAEIDLVELEGLLDGAETGDGGSVSDLEPAPYIALPDDLHGDLRWKAARERGEDLLRAGKVAAFTVAGGQGTRLGFDGPKGTFPVTPVKRKPLFRVFAEKIRAAERVYGTSIPWLIMTSHANHDATVAFLEKNGFFGLPAENVSFFRQGRMPAVTFDGKILLEAKSSIAMSPDGHGGSLRAMVRSGIFETLRSRGIEVISYFQVDNPLVRVIDPWFIGFHSAQGSEMSSRMIPKAHPDEKVGVFCTWNGRIDVVEYSDLPEKLARATDGQGRIRFNSGNIAVHLLETSLVERVAGSGETLPFHRAKKKVPHLDDAGERVSPSEPNAIKFEMFVFDAVRMAENPLILETGREDEFSPVKNATGEDSAETCLRDQLKQFARWMRAAGIDMPVDENGVPAIRIEISPLFARDEDSFREAWKKLPRKPEVRDGLYLE